MIDPVTENQDPGTQILLQVALARDAKTISLKKLQATGLCNWLSLG